jgi:hypothetical protein
MASGIVFAPDVPNPILPAIDAERPCVLVLIPCACVAHDHRALRGARGSARRTESTLVEHA